jgi:hypothetical protein
VLGCHFDAFESNDVIREGVPCVQASSTSHLQLAEK